MTDNVDKTIDEICGWIQKRIKDGSVCICEGSVAEMTKALAELVSARAQVK